MQGLQQYGLTVISAAVLCAIIPILADGAGKQSLHLLCSVLLAVVVVSPIVRIDPDEIFRAVVPEWEENFLTSEGKSMATEAMAELIKTECETYILDKAKSLGLSVSVTVLLGEEELPVPKGVMIYGSADEESKRNLTVWLEDAFGITEEALQWIG